MKRLLFVSMLALSVAGAALAEQRSPTKRGDDSVAVPITALRYHPGDSLHWADPDYDDQRWPSVHPAAPQQGSRHGNSSRMVR